jgi:glycine/D-amino acid oxidase-like deaminating enzyme
MVTAALSDAKPAPFWLDDPAAPVACPPLRGEVSTDLAVVGGGYTGLWTALLAKEQNPSAEVVLLEGRTIGWAASGRNGGFCSSSLTHGIANGLSRFAREMPTLERLGLENLDAIEDAVERYGIDCGFERTGELTVATEPHQVEWMSEAHADAKAFGHDVALLDSDEVRAEIDSPTYLGGVWSKNTTAMVDPARLAWGLKAACLSLGVRIYEHTPVRAITPERWSVGLNSSQGTVRARTVALGTNAFPALLRRVRPYLLPVYDYALMTEPLTSEQLASVGWRNRQGVGDSANQFHYYRLTHDNRILWGGYDAIYHYGNGLATKLDQRPATFTKLAEHFFETFPQLEGLRFSHTWGGAIDTCSRFCAFFGKAMGGRVAYAAGYTGLGVGATRFGAQVMLDLLSGEHTELTDLEMVRGRPVPFPPEPLRSGVVQLTRWSLDQADKHDGKRNPWLRTLDRLGLGFDT